jgi:hypothetical protein
VVGDFLETLEFRRRPWHHRARVLTLSGGGTSHVDVAKRLYHLHGMETLVP